MLPFAKRTALEARHRKAGLRTLLDASCRAGLLGLVCDRFGDGGCDPLVEDGGDDVVLREVLCRDHVGNRLCGGELHRLVYLTGPDVEGAPEDTWEAKDVVDLVRVVAASGGDDPRLPHGDLGPYLGIGLAMAKMIGSWFMLSTCSTVSTSGAESPRKRSAPATASARSPVLPSGLVFSANHRLDWLRSSRPS